MNPEHMTWVAGFSIVGILYLLYRHWLMSNALQTMWETFKSETDRMEAEQKVSNAITDAVVNSLIESVDRFDERVGIVEAKLGEAE